MTLSIQPTTALSVEEFLKLPESQQASILTGKFPKNLYRKGNTVHYKVVYSQLLMRLLNRKKLPMPFLNYAVHFKVVQ